MDEVSNLVRLVKTLLISEFIWTISYGTLYYLSKFLRVYTLFEGLE